MCDNNAEIKKYIQSIPMQSKFGISCTGWLVVQGGLLGDTSCVPEYPLHIHHPLNQVLTGVDHLLCMGYGVDVSLNYTWHSTSIQHNLFFLGVIRDHPPKIAKIENEQQSTLETYHPHCIALTYVFFARIYVGTEGSFMCTMSHYLRHPPVGFARFDYVKC